MRRPCLGTLIIVLGVSACDRLSGAGTTTKLDHPPPIDCMTSAIKGAVGRHVEPLHNQSKSYELLPHPGPVSTDAWTWIYGPGGGLPLVEVIQNNQGVTYWNGLRRMGGKVSDEQVRAMLPL